MLVKRQRLVTNANKTALKKMSDRCFIHYRRSQTSRFILAKKGLFGLLCYMVEVYGGYEKNHGQFIKYSRLSTFTQK